MTAASQKKLADQIHAALSGQGLDVEQVQKSKREKPRSIVDGEHRVIVVAGTESKWPYLPQEVRITRTYGNDMFESHAIPVVVKPASDGELMASLPLYDLIRLMREAEADD